jgi:hypothetical protein
MSAHAMLGVTACCSVPPDTLLVTCSEEAAPEASDEDTVAPLVQAHRLAVMAATKSAERNFFFITTTPLNFVYCL